MLINTKWYVYIVVSMNFFGLLGGYSSFFGGTRLFSVIWAFNYLILIPLIINVLVKMPSIKTLFILLFIIYVFSSAFWSTLPLQTMQYAFSFSMNVLLAVVVYYYFGYKKFVVFLRDFINIFIALGLILYVLGVEAMIYYDPLDRSNLFGFALADGFFSHKIYAGFYSSLALLLNISNPYKKISIRYFCILSALTSIILSGSSIGLLCCFLVISLKFYLYIFERGLVKAKFLIPISFLVVLILVNFYFALPFVVEYLGRDMTFTGRTLLWDWGIYFISEKPIFGWGYSGIFSDSVNAPSMLINRGEYYQAPHFHNGYIQVCAELGIVGLLFYVCVLVNSLSNTYTLFSNNRESVFLIFLIVALLVAVGMNIFSRYNEFSTFLIFYFFFLSHSRINEKGYEFSLLK